MRAIEIAEFGGPEVLRVVERPTPQPGAGEVLVKVLAAGVNRPDALQRAGTYPPPPGASDLPGLELAGEIVSGDLQGSEFKIGDQVCALVTGGAYAEYCVVPVQQCLPIPAGFSLVEAAGLPETFFTVWSNVFERGALTHGETLLVHGGASGIGTTAIQLAVALGNTAYATAGSDERVEAINRLGGIGINYKTQAYEEVIKAKTGGRGVDVILDMVAGDYIDRDLKCLADDGRIVIIALLGGAKATINCGEILRRRLTVTGSTLRPRPVAFKAALARALRERVWPLLESGQIRPVVHATFPLEQADRAHAMMEAGEQVGKIILVP
ncbi:NAD(P)H-quinone oxidoreductase [Alcaligenes sp. WGS1538]|uniref:NAD(P)H-quinone oxidoreductase n=1 Tax=Alcaligenes sp. WGS1538 TaxID=3366811 RepID=UPI00372D85CF